ncbi:TadE family protein [Nocardiopsis composta]|uniref:TadE-like domain-containing protein n=1 Tax=Nocardiopsis composta TaxID=157465 RepID=A0A7W8QSN6_9ACTN|nr:TadE family protein [Nocardiopsis composta]MBB5435210.1 hypothetical protein [Nocardiopsis composta]
MNSRQGEKGSTELVMVLPIAFTMLMAVFQAGLWTHAQQRAEAVAERAMAAARAHDADAATGRREGHQALEQLRGAMLTHPRLQVQRTGGQARARLSADAPSLVPGWTPQVVAERSGPVERLETP